MTKAKLEALTQHPVPLSLVDGEKRVIGANAVHAAQKKGALLLIDMSALGYYILFSELSDIMDMSSLKEMVQVSLLRKILEYVRTFNTGKVVLCWDSKTSKRKEIYPMYKGQRNASKSEDDLKRILVTKKALLSFRKHIVPLCGFNSVLQAGYECDDMIAMLVCTANRDQRIIMVANDGDLFQLLPRARVEMFHPMYETLIGISDFIKKNGYHPSKVVLCKALCGCVSDNVKGVGGVGEKTFIKFLNGDTDKVMSILSKKQSVKIVKRNMKLVALPMKGTRVPVLHSFSIGAKGVLSALRQLSMPVSSKTKEIYGKLF